MDGVSNFLVKADRFCDYVPLVSSITNLADLFQKCVVLPFMDEETIASNHYYKHINDKSFARCLLLLVPVIGNIIVGISDFSNKKTDEIKKEPPKINEVKVKLFEKNACMENYVAIGEQFSIELSHSPSTGYQPWKMIGLPWFVEQIDAYVIKDQTSDLETEGGGSNYVFVFKAEESGTGPIIMRLPCSSDESRTIEKKFIIISQ